MVVDGQVSHWLPVTSGVSQGSIIGPLLFIIYITDLPSVLTSSTPYLFADDTMYCKCISTLDDAIFFQSDLNYLSEWSYKKNLFFNIPKSCLLLFHNGVKDVTTVDYFIDGRYFVPQDRCRNLDVIFSSDLSLTELYN